MREKKRLKKKKQVANSSKIVTDAFALVEGLCEFESFDLIDVESVYDGGKWILRFYIDTDDGVKLEHCVAMSRQISSLLDVELFDKNKLDYGEYHLEVSSPGIDRVLLSDEDFQKKIGEKITVKLLSKLNDKNKITGILTEFIDGVIKIDVNGDLIAFEKEQISRAWLLI